MMIWRYLLLLYNICCDPSLELSLKGNYNEGHNICLYKKVIMNDHNMHTFNKI